MDRELLEACSNGDLVLCRQLIFGNPNILTSITPDGNNCLHIAAMIGHVEFAKEMWLIDPYLLCGINIYGETPLITALIAANATLASDMIVAATQYLQPDSRNDIEGEMPLNEMLLKYDRCGDTVLHHAIRNNFENLAIQLLSIEPRLAEQVNNWVESPLHMAARRGQSEVLDRLLSIPSLACSGPEGVTALDAAVHANHTDIIKQLLERLPELAYCKCQKGWSPIGNAVLNGNLEIVKIFLKHDPNLAYIRNGNENMVAFIAAANRGFVPIAEEIIRVCPDSAYATIPERGVNALHLAIMHEYKHFVDYILRTPKLHRLINQADNYGNLPLHAAAIMCNPEILRSLLFHGRQDYNALNATNSNAVDLVYEQTTLFKTLKWKESITLVSNVIPSGWRNSAVGMAKKEIRKQARQEIKSLTERYTTNTSLVAALLATITFAAAFTLPGGYISDNSDAGLPIFARKAAFQVFLISDTIAMSSSIAVAFLCILATWEDMDFLLNYRKTTRALMWCAYVGTVVAFGTGLFTVVAPKNMWLAVLILVLCSILPLLSKIIGEWPILMLRLRLGHLFQKELITNI